MKLNFTDFYFGGAGFNGFGTVEGLRITFVLIHEGISE